MAPLPIAEPSSPSSLRSRSRHGDNQSESSRISRVSPSSAGPSRSPSPSADSTRSRTPRPPRVRPQPSPRGDKRDRPGSIASRGGARRRRRDEDEAETTEEIGTTDKPEEFDIGTDEEDGPGHDPAAASSGEPQLPFADANEDSEEELPSDTETVDYRSADEEDDSDRGSGGPPTRTRTSDWLVELPKFAEEIRAATCEMHEQQGSAPRLACEMHVQQGSAPRLRSNSDQSDLESDLKKNVQTFFALHCKDQGIIPDLDDIEVTAPVEQSQFAYFGNTPVGPATCPRTGKVVTSPSARDGANGDSDEYVELELSPQASQLYGISEEFGSQL